MLLTFLLTRLFGYVTLRVRGGPAKGLKCVAAMSRDMQRGQYEGPRWEAISPLIREEDVFWDVGAHKGYVTLIAARRTSEKGKVYSFEPWPPNLWCLKRNIALNNWRHVRVLATALADVDGTSTMGGGRGGGTKRIGTGEFPVQLAKGDTLIANSICESPTFLKMDVEGAEARALMGLAGALRQTVRFAIVSTHGVELHETCCKLLEAAGLVPMTPQRAKRVLAGECSGKVMEPEILAFRDPMLARTDRIATYLGS